MRARFGAVASIAVYPFRSFVHCNRWIRTAFCVYLLDYIILLTVDLSIAVCTVRAFGILTDWDIRIEQERESIDARERDMWCDNVRNNVSRKSISLHYITICIWSADFVAEWNMMGTKTSQTIAANKQYSKRFLFLIGMLELPY